MTTQMLGKDEAEGYAEWFAVLADATRVRLLHALSTSRSGAMRVGDLAGALGRPDDASVDDHAVSDARIHADHLLALTIRRALGQG